MLFVAKVQDHDDPNEWVWDSWWKKSNQENFSSIAEGIQQKLNDLFETVQLDAPKLHISTKRSASPQQSLSGNDCGVFTCMTADCVSLNCPPTFGAVDANFLRKKIALTILAMGSGEQLSLTPRQIPGEKTILRSMKNSKALVCHVRSSVFSVFVSGP